MNHFPLQCVLDASIHLGEAERGEKWVRIKQRGFDMLPCIPPWNPEMFKDGIKKLYQSELSSQIS